MYTILSDIAKLSEYCNVLVQKNLGVNYVPSLLI